VTKLLDFILLLLSQFAGGPGPRENNLMRFGLPALLWGVLLVVAWLRQRQHDLPREKLLVLGFGLGLARELFMFSHVAMNFLGTTAEGWGSFFIEPLEHLLTMAAIVVVAGAFLRYILNDVRLSRRYLWAGLVVTGLCTFGTTLWWSQYSIVNPASKFNQTCGGVFFHATTSVFLGYAIFMLARKRGWLRTVVSLALIFFLLSGLLKLFNFATSRVYTHALCPIANSFHILAIPLLGYVYLREQSIEKDQAEQELRAYRDHLEELVSDRTAKLTKANAQLQWEIAERKQVEIEIARRSVQLGAQNAIAATISQSLDLDTVLNTALDTVLAVLEVDVGSVYLLEPDGQTLALQVHRGRMPAGELAEIAKQGCPCAGICAQAVTEMKPVVADVSDFPVEHDYRFVLEEDICTLLSTPLISKGQAVGALTLGARRPNSIQAQDLDILTAIGQQIGMAVENARLYQETERWAEELALLHQVSIFLTSTLDPTTIYEQITEQATKLLVCQAAIILQWYEDRQEAVGIASYAVDGFGANGPSLRPDQSDLLLDLITHRQPIAIQDVQNDSRLPLLWQEQFKMRACLCLPVWGTGKSLALLFLIDQQEPRQWRADEVALKCTMDWLRP
jgi:GAF domain-containing protein